MATGISPDSPLQLKAPMNLISETLLIVTAHLQASNGAEQAVSSTLYLGASIDADTDGQPGASSNGR